MARQTRREKAVDDPDPQDGWSLERLGEFCTRIGRRWAVDAWRLGRALNIAFGKVANGGWGKWCAEHLPDISEDRILQWRNLARRVADPTELNGLTLRAACELVGIISADPPEEPASGSGEDDTDSRAEDGGNESTQRDRLSGATSRQRSGGGVRPTGAAKKPAPTHGGSSDAKRREDTEETPAESLVKDVVTAMEVLNESIEAALAFGPGIREVIRRHSDGVRNLTERVRDNLDLLSEQLVGAAGAESIAAPS